MADEAESESTPGLDATPESSGSSEAQVETSTGEAGQTDDQILNGLGIEVTPESGSEPSPAAEAETAAAASPSAGTTPAKPTGQPASTLSPQEQEIVSRFKLDAADLPANPERRTAFLSNLKQRHDEQSRLWQQSETYRTQLEQFQKAAPAQQQQRQPLPSTQQAQVAPERAAAYEKLQSTLGSWGMDDVGNALRETLEASGVSQLQDVVKSHQQIRETVEQYQIEQGMDQVSKILPGMDLSETTETGRANLQKLYGTAQSLINLKYDPRKFNIRHALAEAASVAFQTDIQLSERRRLARSQSRALRGGSDPGERPAHSRPQTTEEDLDNAVLDRINTGEYTKDELEAVARGRG